MQIKPFIATCAKVESIASPDIFCDNAKELYRAYRDKGLFETHTEPALYIYRIEASHRRHTGIVGINDVEDFFMGKVKKHEKTLSEREQHQLELFLQWEAVLKPVLLTYPPNTPIQGWLDHYTRRHKSLFSVHLDKAHQTHRIWAITEPADIAEVQRLFAQHVHSVYIADGHHRTATIALLHELADPAYQRFDFDHLFCAYFATDQLRIADYNRVVDALESLSPATFMAHLSRLFEIEPLAEPRKPQEKHELVMYLRTEWFALRWQPRVLDAYPTEQVVLDAELLNEHVLHSVLGIEDVRTDQRIAYVDGTKSFKGILKQVGHKRSKVGFMLFPVSFDDMMRLADLGESLPPKSTYFEPRLRSGIIVQSLLRDDDSVTQRPG